MLTMTSVNRLQIFLLGATILLNIDFAKCYPHKRATGGLPGIVQELLSSENNSTSSGMVSLLETQNQLLSKIVVSLEILTKGTQLTAGDCSDVASHGPYATGAYTITPWDDLGYRSSFRVYCDMETLGGGWTVVQKRFDGSVDFYRGWEDYRNGFGDIDGGEHWLGLSRLSRLTNSGLSWELRIELEDFENNTAFAQYENFRVGDESTSFQLTLGSYSGSAGDGLGPHAGMAFTTKDKDNDIYGSNCAVEFKGAWWYNACVNSNLNGLYLASTSSGMAWPYWKGYEAYKRVEMKIRPVIQ